MRVVHAEMLMREHNPFKSVEDMARYFLSLYPPHQLALVQSWTNQSQQVYYLRETFKQAAERILEPA
jgi:hypothetical protein